MLSHFILLICCVLVGDVTASFIQSKPLSILVIMNIPSPSHHMWTENLVEGLLRKGHHVHVVSIQETKVKSKLAQNLTYTIFDEVRKLFQDSDDYNSVEFEQYSTFYSTYFLYLWSVRICDATIKAKAAKELLEMIKTVEYDVIVQDITLAQCLYGLWEVAKGKPPVVGYVPYGPAPWLKDFTGGPNYPTVRPFPHATFAIPEGLWLRTWNAMYFIVDEILRNFYYFPIAQQMADEYIGHAIRPLHEIEDDINIVLVNSHAAFDPAIPLPPNTLEVAGLNSQAMQPIAGEIVETYPEDVGLFLDGAKNGAVVISLGTNVKWKVIGLDKIKTVILALSKLKQRVLWKLDIEVPYEIPNNVMIMKWLPQRKVLSHKNVRAIWTHGGGLSTQEAIWIGVPMIVMPFFMDQKSNMHLLVAKGVGVSLDVKTLSTQSILHAFEEILYNESYTRNMKQLSSEFRDRPVPPLDLAIWGIEYAVRHPNGSLVTPLRSQSWVQQNLIDVYALLCLSFFLILLFIFFVMKLLINYCYNCICPASKVRKSKQS